MIIDVPLALSETSGSAPSRPTRVKRASCEGRLVENVRDERDGRVLALRRIGDSRKDMLVVAGSLRDEMLLVEVSRNVVCLCLSTLR